MIVINIIKMILVGKRKVNLWNMLSRGVIKFSVKVRN